MTYIFSKPDQLNFPAFAAHVLNAGITVFGDRIVTNGSHVVFHLPDDAEPLTDEEQAVLDAAVASYVYVEPYDYAALRIEQYDARIPIGHQLDALRKGLDSPEWQAVVATADAIKAEIPKQRPDGQAV